MKIAVSAASLAVLMLLFATCTAAIKLNETSSFQTCLRTPSSCTMLSLDSSRLTGSLPRELARLTRLTSMSMTGNQLTGTVPTELGALTDLTALYFGTNNLTGTLPTELIALTRLTWMGFHSNRISGTVMSELGILTSLTRINLPANQLTGTLPSELRALTSVDLLICQNARLCGDIPAGVTLFSDTFCPTATGGTLLGSVCPSFTPTAAAGEQPLKDNWFPKLDVARQSAFDQKLSWFRKQAKLDADKNNTA